MHKNDIYTGFSSTLVREDHQSSIFVFIAQAQFFYFLRPACSPREWSLPVQVKTFVAEVEGLQCSIL